MASVQIYDDDYPEVSTDLRSTYESVIEAIDAPSASVLEYGAARLCQAVRRAADRNVDLVTPGKAAERWLRVNIGEVDDPLRRAAVAALALGLRPDVLSLPGDMLTLYPKMHARLARFLIGTRPYTEDLFAKDIAFAAGVSASIGALTVALPTAEAPRLTLLRAKRAAAGFRRQWAHAGADEAVDWLWTWSLQPWAELHVDTRDLSEFNAEGFRRCYHRLAGLMALRPDLAGVYGASWLYQPELSTVSPHLAFARETAEAGGGRVVRLRADPAQTAFAIARSRERRRLFMSGAYKPVCYGMFWDRRTLMDWARSDRARRL